MGFFYPGLCRCLLFIVLVCPVTGFSGPGIKMPADTSGVKKLRFSFLDNSYQARLLLPLSIHPDFQCVKLSKDSGVWKNMVGHTFGLVRLQARDWQVSTAIAGYVELHDMIPQFMSWELWRGNLGGSIYLEKKRLNSLLPGRSRVVLQLGWYHESQHASDITRYIAEYTRLKSSDSFNNATARSFEYIVLQLHYTYTTGNDKWTFLLYPGYRYYPDPLLSDVRRDMKNACSIELGLHYRVNPFSGLYLHGFLESIQTDLVSDGTFYKYRRNKEPLVYRQIEAGLRFTSRNRQCDVFIRYNHSNGRGLDFYRTFSQAGGGIRFTL